MAITRSANVGWHVVGHANGHHPGMTGQRIGHDGGDPAVVTGKAPAFIRKGAR
jgi:hypothetical protein